MSTSSSSTDVQLQVLQALNINNLIKPFDDTNKSINIKTWFSNLERYFKLNGTISSEYFDYLLLKLDGESLEIASQYDGNYFQVKKQLILLFDSNKSCISAERELDSLTRQIDRIQDLDSNASKIKFLCRIVYQGKSGEERLKVTKLPMRYNDFDWDLFILDMKQSFEIDSAEYRERRFPNRNLKLPSDSHNKEKRCLNLGCKFPYNHDTSNCKMQKILKDHKSLPKNNLVMSDSPNNLLTSLEKECNTVFDKNECLESSQDDSDSDASLSDAPGLIYKSGKISNISVVIAIDSGSTFTSISDNLQYLLKMPDKEGSEVPIKLIEGMTAAKRAKGKRLLTIEGNSIYLKHPLIFNSHHHNFDILLGRDMLKKYGAIVDHTDGAINWSVTGKCIIKNTNSLNFLITPSKFSPTTHDDITFDDLKVFQYGIDVNANEESKTYALYTESVIVDQDKQKYLDEFIAASDKSLREKFPSVFIVNDSQIVPTMIAEDQHFNFTEQNKNYKTYGLSYHNQSIALQLAKTWEDAGIIEEGEPDNGITHPVILIDKQKDSLNDNKNVDITSRYRLVCDFRCINEFTHKHCEISMNITNSILINRPFVFCSKLDFKTAYGQIKLHPSNTRSFNITIGHKKFNYLTLPQGARNSATLFKIVMMNLFQDLFEQQHLQWYHDDMLIMTHADSQSPL
uniref:Reverse transcriptase domain-containing protein n=1 Tax=Strongyloides papillosus TaxID=174720 RepID=A0A0N5BI82_STREA